ncbi:hypothetical protein NBO_20g0025 [Nosema bombycis CQ1]|uniref:Uncharacterized protein n=1 Tax=Nosema bombycis (strain CQ1 / CVCC 102059) TaxID=578461 RepID=R0KWN2_NOSB1|nr:hypothetical protein NBO_20g0025 [Nosema bombycis CQ1]|eukprot:EOB14637.1 hypothetical protein NBO_20g0025 [Nosema bombycis CQ1]
MHRTKDGFTLKINKAEAFNQFLKVEYSNLINIFTFRKSLNNFETEDENIKYLVEDLQNAIKDNNEDNQKSLSDLIKNFIDHTKNSNPTIDLQFEAFMKFKQCLFDFIRFDLDTSLRFDIFDGENFKKIRRCLKINILGHDNLNTSNTKVELFDKEDNKVEKIRCLLYGKDIILLLDKLKEKRVVYVEVHHKVNGRIKKSDKIFLK